jgi:predicted metal-dependent phosphoesterase TrpH
MEDEGATDVDATDGNGTGPIRRYDLQVHTDASPCSAASPATIAHAASEAGLDGIAITNHDTTEGVREVRHAVSGLDAGATSGIDVIAGVEVTTTQGHLLALDVSEAPPQADPLTAIENVHEQGGLAVLSHPFDRLRQVYDRDLEEIATVVDGIETRNSRCVRPRYNADSRAFAARFELTETGGSDAHFPREVGRAATECHGDVLEAIRAGETRAVGRGGYLSGHVATKLDQFRGSLG